MKKAINIRFEETMLAQLDDCASELDRSRTYLIEKAVSAYFDTFNEIVADNRIDDLKTGRSTVVSMEDVFEQAGIVV